MDSAAIAEAAQALAYASRRRRELIEKPLREHLERAGYDYAAFVAECEGHNLTVTLNGECGVWNIMVWRKPPTTPKDGLSTAPQPVDPRDPLASWIDSSYSFTPDQLARCLRAEMAAVGTFPGGWERRNIERALQDAQAVRA